MRGKSFWLPIVPLVLANFLCIAPTVANPLTAKYGYFNLPLLRSRIPQLLQSEVLKVTVENQLRRQIDETNKSLLDAQKAGKSKQEIDAMTQTFQTEASASQKALVDIIQTQRALETQSIASAVSKVAKDRGLDIIVESTGTFAGNSNLASAGVNITQNLIELLSSESAAGARVTDEARQSPSETSSKKAPQSLTASVGYFDLANVKAACKSCTEAEKSRAKAESDLIQEVAEGNKRIEEAQKSGKSNQEMEAISHNLHDVINSHKKQLLESVQAKGDSSYNIVALAATTAAQQNSLAMLVDGASVWFGGEAILKQGVDITEKVLGLLPAAEAGTLAPVRTGDKAPAKAISGSGSGVDSEGSTTRGAGSSTAAGTTSSPPKAPGQPGKDK